MTNKEWIDGVFTESETDYKIAGMNILYKNEEDYLIKGVELLCNELNPTSVLEFGTEERELSNGIRLESII